MSKKYILLIVLIIIYIFFLNKYYINNHNKEIGNKLLINDEERPVSFSLFIDNIDTYYIAKGELFNISKYKDNIIKYYSLDDNIASIDNNGIISGNNIGNTIITGFSDNNKYMIKIVVTELLVKPEYNLNKKNVTCGYYSAEDAHLLDKILETRIKASGEGSRGALLEAARFLTLSLPVKIPYFFENGRLENYDGQAYVDGEGRYYHKGLYLSTDKYNDIVSSFSGPQMWGCPLTNYDDTYGWDIGGKYPNGLDCSGFVTWALYNGGIDVLDIGAGITPNIRDLSDIGEKHNITYSYVNSDDYHVGDIIAISGHTALIVGKDNKYLYVAESLKNGVRVEKYNYTNKKSSLYNNYSYIEKLDNLYNDNTNYENMWD